MGALCQTPTNQGQNVFRIGDDRAVKSVAGHRLLADGLVSLTLPPRPLTESEAKRLAWGILADLAPDEVAPIPQVVNYRESGRCQVLTHLAEGPRRIPQLADLLNWNRRTVERRLAELIGDGRVKRVAHSPYDITFEIDREAA